MRVEQGRADQQLVARLRDARGLSAGSAMAAPGAGLLDGSYWIEQPGAAIGRYTLVSRLGEGGMGQVWLAEQTEPVRRQVALKIMKPGLDSAQALSRFEQERQALALMDHPGIEKIFDAGMTERGRPYFVSEYVPGPSITAYCDEQRLTIEQRLELFMEVCDAVQHAHQKGVIHRDLKPSNILTAAHNGTAVPKVIDFGIAKALEAGLTEQTLYTEQGQLIGTPAYMSPEQAGQTADRVDTRMDVYALGALLYELLCGRMPIEASELRSAGIEEVRRRIREVEPPRPSARLRAQESSKAGEVAQRRSASVSGLLRALRGDLDWITMKAMEKDPARRYASAHELAADIRRHLAHEPVIAGPPTARYRIRKFIRRHRVGVGVATGFLMLITAAAVGLGLLYREADRQWHAAEMARDQAQVVAEFHSSMLGETDAKGMGLAIVDSFEERIRAAMADRYEDPAELDQFMHDWRQQTLRAGPTNVALSVLDEFVLAKAAKAIETNFADQPLIRAALQQALANTYRDVGLYETAMPLQEAALATRCEVLGRDHLDTLDSMSEMGVLLYWQSRYDEALPYLRESLRGHRRIQGDDHPDTLNVVGNMGTLLQALGDVDGSLNHLEEALVGRRRVLGNDDEETIAAIGEMGSMLLRMKRNDEALALFREGIEASRRVLGDDHQKTLTLLANTGLVLHFMGEDDQAVAHLGEALDGFRRVLGDHHLDTLITTNMMGFILTEMHRFSEAEAYCRAAVEGKRQVLGDDHLDTLIAINNLGRLLRKMGRLSEAETLGAEAVRGARARFAPTHDFRVAATWQYGISLTSLRRFAEAEEALLEAYSGAVARTHGRPDHPAVGQYCQAVIDLYSAWDAAEPDQGYDLKAAEWRAKLPPAEDSEQIQ
ncbi:MAG: tetratricopeptide repeat protein [Phycisphaerales bacterium JB039]